MSDWHTGASRETARNNYDKGQPMTIRSFFSQLVRGPLGARRGASNQALDELHARQATRHYGPGVATRLPRSLSEVISAQAHRLPVTRAEEKRISDHWDRCTEQTTRDVARYEEWIAQHG